MPQRPIPENFKAFRSPEVPGKTYPMNDGAHNRELLLTPSLENLKAKSSYFYLIQHHLNSQGSWNKGLNELHEVSVSVREVRPEPDCPHIFICDFLSLWRLMS